MVSQRRRDFVVSNWGQLQRGVILIGQIRYRQVSNVELGTSKLLLDVDSISLFVISISFVFSAFTVMILHKLMLHRPLVCRKGLRVVHLQPFLIHHGRFSTSSSKAWTWWTPWKRLQRWASHRRFYYHVSGLGLLAGGIYVSNLETIPVSGRRRFNIVTPEAERALGLKQYEVFMEEFKKDLLPDSTAEVKAVKRVMKRLVKALDHMQNTREEFIEDDQVVSGAGGSLDEWDIHVVDSEIPNAFVLPGNKVFVFSAILKICEDDNGIATVLGHEISHNLCHHEAESRSTNFLQWAVVLTAWFLSGGIDLTWLFFADLAFSMPRNRRQESEADHIGLDLMALACYDPREASKFWTRMSKSDAMDVPTFFSTHPSHALRVQQIAGWMNEATAKYQNSNCGETSKLCELHGI